MAKGAGSGILAFAAALVLSGCIGADAITKYPDADGQTGHRINGEYSDQWCAPDPKAGGDSVTISMFVDFAGSGTITMTGQDGPPRVIDVNDQPQVDDDSWHRGWNTGTICFDIDIDGKGEYAVGAYLD